MIQEEVLYVYNIYNIIAKHFRINIALVRSRGGVSSSYYYGFFLYLFQVRYYVCECTS
jgi:hypothetical protein